MPKFKVELCREVTRYDYREIVVEAADEDEAEDKARDQAVREMGIDPHGKFNGTGWETREGQEWSEGEAGLYDDGGEGPVYATGETEELEG